MQIFFFTLEEKWEEKRFVYVEVGLNLPGNVDVVVASQCLYGDTAVYDLLLTIIGSLTDAAPLQTWLEETWIPTLMQK
ncbi:MAG: hypothetical protein MRZ51_05285 [Faecalibacterium sp.]|nr:hypothetical protein [Faecalibacterium sp.]